MYGTRSRSTASTTRAKSVFESRRSSRRSSCGITLSSLGKRCAAVLQNRATPCEQNRCRDYRSSLGRFRQEIASACRTSGGVSSSGGLRLPSQGFPPSNPRRDCEYARACPRRPLQRSSLHRGPKSMRRIVRSGDSIPTNSRHAPIFSPPLSFQILDHLGDVLPISQLRIELSRAPQRGDGVVLPAELGIGQGQVEADHGIGWSPLDRPGQ